MNSIMNAEENAARGPAATLSVYMDGELPAGQRDRMLHLVKSDAALREDWLVYHCIGDALRSEDAVPLTAGFGSRFKARLEDEAYLMAPEVSKTVIPVQRWRLPVAVAASVAAVVTAGLLVFPPREGAQTALLPVGVPAVVPLSSAPSAPPALAAVPPGAAAPAAALQGSASSATLSDPALRFVSSEYLMAHRHYSGGLTIRGVVSHVRTAGYDGQ